MRTNGKSEQRRVALYSHDTQGLGHIRRNLAIASALLQDDRPPVILLISGTQIGSTLTKPPGVDFVALPAVAKNADGQYAARSLPLALEEVIRLRASTIRGALEAFAPDVLIVDKTPTGLKRELLPSLRMLRARGQTRCVLGLRDVLDDPVTTRREWARADSGAVVQAYYDAVWIYGDPTIYDPLVEYGLASDLAGKAHYTGYLNRTVFADQQATALGAQTLLAPRFADKRLALCMVGGGEDGEGVTDAFADADFPRDMVGLIVAGPYMPVARRQQLQRLATRRGNLQVVDFVPESVDLLRRAHCVVAMGGYNTVCEILAQRKRALIVPRVKPRLEQWIRAQRLHELGLLDRLHPDELTPDRLSQWLATTATPPPSPPVPIDLHGLNRLPRLLDALCTGQSAPQHGWGDTQLLQPRLVPA